MEQQAGSKWGKEYIKAVYCHPAYLTYMQSTAYEMLSWMLPDLWQKAEDLKELLDEGERGE